MKKKTILFVTGSIYPNIDNNANLLIKLADCLNSNYNIVFAGYGKKETSIPYSVKWIDYNPSFFDKGLSIIIDRHGYSDAILKRCFLRNLRRIIDEIRPDIIVCSCEPYYVAMAVSELRCLQKVLYLMDPPAIVIGDNGTPYRNRNLKRLLSGYDRILTTPFIYKALMENGFKDICLIIKEVGFPMIVSREATVCVHNSPIKLLFSGWLYSEIRSPEYFIEIIKRLDERFSITFMGKECERLRELYDFDTKAEIITVPNQPYDIALKAIDEADILINIGNSVPVHMPSKTLEYINSGKPLINFYKSEDCPTLFYTKRYPLCHNILEGSKNNIDDVAKEFIDFCIENKGKTISRDYIEKEYYDCVPKYIAQIIIDE